MCLLFAERQLFPTKLKFPKWGIWHDGPKAMKTKTLLLSIIVNDVLSHFQFPVRDAWEQGDRYNSVPDLCLLWQNGGQVNKIFYIARLFAVFQMWFLILALP